MAIGASQAFKDAMRAPVKKLKAIIATGLQVFTSSDDSISLFIESSGYYFGATTKALNFSLLGTTHNLVGQTVHVSISVQTDSINDTWKTCDIGNFYVSEQNAILRKETTSSKAYDKVGILANTLYQSGGLTFPCTIVQLVNQIYEKIGLAYTPTTLVNGSYQITEDVWHYHIDPVLTFGCVEDFVHSQGYGLTQKQR